MARAPGRVEPARREVLRGTPVVARLEVQRRRLCGHPVQRANLPPRQFSARSAHTSWNPDPARVWPPRAGRLPPGSVACHPAAAPSDRSSPDLRVSAFSPPIYSPRLPPGGGCPRLCDDRGTAAGPVPERCEEEPCGERGARRRRSVGRTTPTIVPMRRARWRTRRMVKHTIRAIVLIAIALGAFVMLPPSPSRDVERAVRGHLDTVEEDPRVGRRACCGLACRAGRGGARRGRCGTLGSNGLGTGPGGRR